jgi:predicted nucleic acid-binding protein
VVIPAEVHAELLSADAPPIVSGWANALPSWVDVKILEPAVREDTRWVTLHFGERAAIALALLLHPSALLIDDRAGSAMARSLGLPDTGTLGVLDEAARRKLISLPDAIDRLKRTSFRYPRAIVARLLEEDAARS